MGNVLGVILIQFKRGSSEKGAFGLPSTAVALLSCLVLRESRFQRLSYWNINTKGVSKVRRHFKMSIYLIQIFLYLFPFSYKN